MKEFIRYIEILGVVDWIIIGLLAISLFFVLFILIPMYFSSRRKSPLEGLFDTDVKKPFACICKKAFLTELELKTHKLSCLENRAMRQAEARGSQEKVIREHEERARKVGAEKSQVEVGNSQDSLKQNATPITKEPVQNGYPKVEKGSHSNENIPSFKCYCDRTFTSEKGLKIHQGSCFQFQALKNSQLRKNELEGKKKKTTPSKPNVATTKSKEKQPIVFKREKGVAHDTKPIAIPKKEKDNIGVAVKDTSTEVKPVKKVRYNIPSGFNTDEKVYPFIKFPEKGAVIRTHRIGATKRAGYKEPFFAKALNEYSRGEFEIVENARLNTGAETRPYEPDISIIDKSSGYNIRIDIEIDEPYAGISRKPIHCIDKDDDVLRDAFFTDRGWIVLRFAEYQVHQFEKECIALIFSLMKAINPSFNIPDDLIGVDSVEKLNAWDLVQAQKWEEAKWREKYLNHEFNFVSRELELKERDLSLQEKNEERLVKSSVQFVPEEVIPIGHNQVNAHQRDRRIQFDPKPHLYKVDGVITPSASTIVSKFFPQFDSIAHSNRLSRQNGLPPEYYLEQWSEKGRVSRDAGTYLHTQIEKFFLNQPYDEGLEEMNHFLKFREEHRDFKPYRTEWRIFDEKYGIAGTADFIAKDHHEFDLYDWKRSDKIVHPTGSVNTTNYGKYGLGILNDISDTRFNRYAIQQSLYRLILERNYGIKIRNMYLVILHPTYHSYYKVPVPYHESEVKNILRSLYEG